MTFLNSKYIVSLGIFTLFSIIVLNGQEHIWLNLDIQSKEGKFGHPHYSKTIKNNQGFRIPSDIDSTIISTCTIDESLSQELFSVRGKKGSDEVIIFDLNGDKSFLDDSCFILPPLTLDKEIDYSSLYIYPSNHTIVLPISYKTLCGRDTFFKTKNISFNVYSKYDTVSNKLYYLKQVKFGFPDKFVGFYKSDNMKLTIQISDHLDWMKIYRFDLSVNQGNNQRILLKQDFQFNGHIYQIDSIDFCNQKLRLTKQAKENSQIVLNGNNIKDNKKISSADLTSTYKIIHIWGTWCPPCLRNLPKLKELPKLYDVQLFGVCVDEDLKKVRKNPIFSIVDWPNIFISHENFKTFNDIKVYNYPTYFLLDKDDQLIGRYGSLDALVAVLNLKKE